MKTTTMLLAVALLLPSIAQAQKLNISLQDRQGNNVLTQTHWVIKRRDRIFKQVDGSMLSIDLPQGDYRVIASTKDGKHGERSITIHQADCMATLIVQ